MIDQPQWGHRVQGRRGSDLRIVLIGVYGKGNLGDEALLLCIRDEIRGRFPGAQIIAFSSDPEAVQGAYGIASFSRTPTNGFAAKLGQIRSADAVILGGGTLVCDTESALADVKAISACFFWPVLAKLLRVPTMAYGQGLGPAAHAIVRWAIRQLMGRMDGVTFRDGRSVVLMANLVRRTGADRIATCDPVISAGRFAPERIAREASMATKAWIAERSPYTAVAIRYPKHGTLASRRGYYRAFARALAGFSGSSESRLLLFPAHVSERYTDDRKSFATLRAALEAQGVPPGRVIETTWATLVDAAAVLQNARLLVGDRLHALLLAAMAGVPVVGVNIEDKILGCLEMIGLGKTCAVLDPKELCSSAAAETIASAWAAGPDARRALRRAVERWAFAGSSNLDVLCRILKPRLA